ncbi:hypothetical protein DNTS_005285 [Danionella cerebrum]|uniref:Ig-like domain-containing protein n=1 Tax=Danionella cerebrum TaxID=2873325 RepID=A0A553R8W9_9TELE|nr:hypothetical protein DNTS_005285 [Danionella translucida]
MGCSTLMELGVFPNLIWDDKGNLEEDRVVSRRIVQGCVFEVELPPRRSEACSQERCGRKRSSESVLCWILEAADITSPKAANASGDRNVHLPLSQHSSEAVFTEVPRDVLAQSGQDVEMACSFRGAGSPSYSLEIQWWYIRNHRDWSDKQSWSTNQVLSPSYRPPAHDGLLLRLQSNQSTHTGLWRGSQRTSVVPQNENTKDATKISDFKGCLPNYPVPANSVSYHSTSAVVKVAGSNISHRLRLSSVKPSDEGTYECRVIDFSDRELRHHRVRAFLRVEGDEGSMTQQADHEQEVEPGRELRRRSTEHQQSSSDCTESCIL